MTEERTTAARPHNGIATDSLLAQEEVKAPGADRQDYQLRLFVSGMTPNSVRAIENARRICEEHLKGCYQLEIIDIYQQPLCAKERRIIVAPTMVKELPLPLHKFVGNLSQTERVLQGLGITPAR